MRRPCCTLLAKHSTLLLSNETPTRCYVWYLTSGINTNGVHMHTHMRMHNGCVWVYVGMYIYMARRVAPVRLVRTSGFGLCGAYAVAVGVMPNVLVAACSACVEILCVDVIKRCIVVCTYAWVRSYGE